MIKARFIRIQNDRIDLNAIKSYTYDGVSLWIETEEDYVEYKKVDIPELDEIVDILDYNLCVNDLVIAVEEED